MRLPRMTTRRWMIAVAVLALSFGGHRYAVALRQKRDDYLARAAQHSRLEIQGRRWMTMAMTRLARPERPEPAPPPPTMTSDEIRAAIDHVVGLPAERPNSSDGDDRFWQAHARMLARNKAMHEWRNAPPGEQELEYQREQVNYHAAMARKYRRAALYPWLPVAPDPLEPK
jgi:hypothetical protein